jgi:protein involved in polysaccharide export with SLBB domain
MKSTSILHRARVRFARALCLTLAALGIPAAANELPLRAGDKIQISIAGVPSDEVVTISKPYTISDGGKINLLHIGEVTAAGLKPSDLQKRIEQTYKAAEVYTHPNVTVSMDTATDARQVFVVSGCVTNGPVPWRANLTLMGAIGTRGGPSPFGDMSKVKVTRTSVNGQRATSTHNLRKYKEDPSVDVLLQPDDLIVIPE